MTSALPPNPYGADLGDRDPLDALADTPGRIRALVECWPDDRFAKSYAPGKWSARRILVHLAQTELALTTRARFALSEDGYAAQPFSQDAWIDIDDGVDGLTALNAYLALRQLNLPMWRKLTESERERRFTHPEYGTLSVWWIAAQLAGHDIHHLKQLAAIE
jgi:hypothetical protein